MKSLSCLLAGACIVTAALSTTGVAAASTVHPRYTEQFGPYQTVQQCNGVRAAVGLFRQVSPCFDHAIPDPSDGGVLWYFLGY